jgi:predicted esterase
VLVVHGENDAIVSVTLGKQLYDLIGAETLRARRRSGA